MWTRTGGLCHRVLGISSYRCVRRGIVHMCTAGLCMVDSVGADAADAANIRDWRWRVVGFRAAVVNPSVVYSRKARFYSIPEFVD